MELPKHVRREWDGYGEPPWTHEETPSLTEPEEASREWYEMLAAMDSEERRRFVRKHVKTTGAGKLI